MLYSILINGAIYLVCLPLLVVMAFIFNAIYKTDWRAFQITALLQLAFALTVPYLLFAGVSLGSAVSAPIIAAALLGFSALLIVAFGLLVFPVVFFIVNREANANRWLGRILGGYLAVVATVFVVDRIHRIADRPDGQSVPDAVLPLEFNVVLYGQILEADGQPSGGAFVNLDGCEAYDRKMLQADDDGLFQVRAHCASSLVISQVRSFSNARACIRNDDSGQPGGPLARFIVDGPYVTEKDKPYWGGFSREKPYRIACNWSRKLRDETMQLSKNSRAPGVAMPKSLSGIDAETPPKINPIVTKIPTAQVKNSRLRLDAHWLASSLVGDGRLYTMQLESSIPAQFAFVEGSHPGWLRLRYRRVGEVDPASGRPVKGYLMLTAIDNGGFHPVGDSYSGDLPDDEYRKTVEAELDDDAAKQVIAYYFLADRGRVEGKLEIIHSMTSRNQILRVKVNASRDIRYSRD